MHYINIPKPATEKGGTIAYMKGNILQVNNAFKIHVAVYNWFLVEVLKPALPKYFLSRITFTTLTKNICVYARTISTQQRCELEKVF